eukprot:Hpha_TRINITY_DN15463_c2_g4::TRINITY_DN15463_c2_g4_i2::g.175418::m.175418/K07198/PRKAA, AMPK; 5'-AMP-activated protein kinase, catalytic alpha subunit
MPAVGGLKVENGKGGDTKSPKQKSPKEDVRPPRILGCPELITHPTTKARYFIGETLGKGGFGVVKLATNQQTGQRHAAKILDMEVVRRDKLQTYIERETSLIQQLNHPHIIKFLEWMDAPEYDLRFFIMELAENGELFDQIVAVSRFSEGTARRYFQQFISGVRYCHSKGVVHRDLKAENLLLDKSNRLKICDFGLSRYCFEEAVTTDRQVMFTSIAGSLDYQAPEILRDCSYHGKPADIWACGVILAFMVSGWLPFQDHSGDDATRMRILARPPRYKVHQDASAEVKDLISSCITVDPKKRISADDVIMHPWFQAGLDAHRCHQLKIPERLLQGAGKDATPSSTSGLNSERGGAGMSPVDDRVLTSSGPVTGELLSELRVAFDTIDTDRSGFIKPEELRDVLIKLASAQDGVRRGGGEAWVPSREEVGGLVRFFDTAGDGRISFHEFVVGFVEKKVESSHSLGEKLRLRDLIEKMSNPGVLTYDPRDTTMKEYIETFRQAFNDIDEDKTGVIRLQELQNLFARAKIEASKEEVEALFQSMDTGHHKFITFEEFVSAWLQSQQYHEVDIETGTPHSRTGFGLLYRLRKCKELITVAEQDEARKTLSRASLLGQHVKGSVRQVADLLRDILTTKLKRLGAAVKLIGETGAGPDGGETSISLKVLSMGPQATCEASFEITSLLEGFARVSCRRLIGKTTMFHRFYNVYLNAMRETQPYIHADD